jgi:hypothetical protein
MTAPRSKAMALRPSTGHSQPALQVSADQPIEAQVMIIGKLKKVIVLAGDSLCNLIV